MGKGTRTFFDILTLILILWGLVFIFLTIYHSFTPNNSSFAFTMVLIFGLGFFAILYTIAFLILIIAKYKEKDLIVMIIGSIIIVGLLPVIYYLTKIRKHLKQNESN